jgi:tetratricopeptide (TPR) repeat protein
MERFEDAIKCFEKVLEVNPKNMQAMNNIGIILGRMGKFDEAIEVFDKVLSIEPKNEVAMFNKQFVIQRKESIS